MSSDTRPGTRASLEKPLDTLPEHGNLFVLSAPSGAGKTSLIKALVESDPSLCVSISHTTRARRPGERDGEHYHFVNAATFDAMRGAGEFLEWAEVFGHRYGTSRGAVAAGLRRGDVILEIDWQGANQVRAAWPRVVDIFVLPPRRAVLVERLHKRGQDPAEVIDLRAAQAAADMSHCAEFAQVVVNDDFEQAVRALRRIVAATRAGERLPRQDHRTLVAALLGDSC